MSIRFLFCTFPTIKQSLFKRVTLRRLLISILLFVGSVVARSSALSEEGVSTEMRKVVVLDDGSTGSRLMTFCFGRHSEQKRFKLISQSPMAEEEPLDFNNGGISDRTAESIATHLGNGFCSSANTKRPAFFLGATAGQRGDEEKAKRLFSLIKKKLIGVGVDDTKYDITLKLLKGSKEGAFNWLAVNYTQSRLDNGLASYGIVELGGKSAQIAYGISHAFDPSDGLSQHLTESRFGRSGDYIRFGEVDNNNSVVRIFADSWNGFGLNQAYKNHINNSAEKEHCDTTRRSFNYDRCKKAMSHLFETKDNMSSKLKAVSMPDTFYLSGYFYDYTVAKGLHSHLMLDDLEAAAKHACQNFSLEFLNNANHLNNGTTLFTAFQALLPQSDYSRVVTEKENFVFSGSIQPVSNEKFCGTLTYMVTLLQRFGIEPLQQLVIVKSLNYEGKNYSGSWPPGYAYAWANDFMPVVLSDFGHNGKD